MWICPMEPLHLHGQISEFSGSSSDRQMRHTICLADESSASEFSLSYKLDTSINCLFRISLWLLTEISLSGGPPVPPPLIAVVFLACKVKAE